MKIIMYETKHEMANKTRNSSLNDSHKAARQPLDDTLWTPSYCHMIAG